MSTTVSSIPKVRLLRSVFTLVQNLRYKEIHKHRHFKNAIEKSAYIDLRDASNKYNEFRH